MQGFSENHQIADLAVKVKCRVRKTVSVSAQPIFDSVVNDDSLNDRKALHETQNKP